MTTGIDGVAPAQATRCEHKPEPDDGADRDRQDAERRRGNDDCHDSQRALRSMRMRQIGGAVENEHRTAVLQVADGLPGTLDEQDVAGPQANRVQVTGNL